MGSFISLLLVECAFCFWTVPDNITLSQFLFDGAKPLANIKLSLRKSLLVPGHCHRVTSSKLLQKPHPTPCAFIRPQICVFIEVTRTKVVLPAHRFHRRTSFPPAQTGRGHAWIIKNSGCRYCMGTCWTLTPRHLGSTEIPVVCTVIWRVPDGCPSFCLQRITAN